jgi:V8-like Glu-specific endopeptidase
MGRSRPFGSSGGAALPRLLATLLTTVLIVLAGAQPASAIAYGENVRAGDYSFSARLTMTGIPTEDHGSRDSWCSGALIAPRWVITAGHCFRDAEGKRVSRTVAVRTTVTIGRTVLGDPGGHEVGVVAVRQSETADVALVELSAAVTDVSPLRVGDTPPAAGEKVRLTGYGLADTGSTTPDRLQTGRFVVNRIGDAVLEISGRAPQRETSACPHDSGGPYFRESPPVLVAVVSSGPTCPHEGPDLSARTDNLAGWITETTTAGPGFLDGMVVRLAGFALLIVLAVVLFVRWRRGVVRAGRRRPRGRGPSRNRVLSRD